MNGNLKSCVKPDRCRRDKYKSEQITDRQFHTFFLGQKAIIQRDSKISIIKITKIFFF